MYYYLEAIEFNHLKEKVKIKIDAWCSALPNVLMK